MNDAIIVIGGVIAAIGAVAATALPEIERHPKIRSM
jgi:hypothetical protein